MAGFFRSLWCVSGSSPRFENTGRLGGVGTRVVGVHKGLLLVVQLCHKKLWRSSLESGVPSLWIAKYLSIGCGFAQFLFSLGRVLAKIKLLVSFPQLAISRNCFSYHLHIIQILIYKNGVGSGRYQIYSKMMNVDYSDSTTFQYYRKSRRDLPYVVHGAGERIQMAACENAKILQEKLERWVTGFLHQLRSAQRLERKRSDRTAPVGGKFWTRHQSDLWARGHIHFQDSCTVVLLFYDK